MAPAADRAAEQSYLELCKQLGAGPCEPFLQCLQEGSRSCKLSHFEQEEQLYATATLLPYAGLQELDLSGLRLSFDGWISILESCAKCPGLQVLSLKGCDLGLVGQDAQEKLASMIGACSIVVLDISQNHLGDNFLLTFSQMPAVAGSTRLTVLDLSENELNDDGIAALAQVMEDDGLQCQVKQLDISFNRLGDQGTCALASMMACVPLLALELEGNQITDVGAVALAAALREAVCLQRLNLNHNKFSAQALLAVADALRLSTSAVQELAVAGASGSEDGVASILLAACSSKTLQLLDVRGLPLRMQAIDAMCRLLASSAPLITIRLDVATKEAAEAIAQALSKNRSLLHLMMGGPVPEHVLSFIAASLSSNTLNKLQRQGSVPGHSSQGAARTPPSQQQQLWSPNGPVAAVKGSAGGLISHRSPASPHRSNSPRRPGSAGLQGRGTAGRPMLVRSTTQQARNLSTLDPSGIGGLASGGAANKAAEVFRRHDSDNSSFLDAEEMMAALQDLGMLEGMKARQLGKFLSNAIREADANQDGQVSLEEFIKYYERLARHYAEAARQGRINTRRKAPVIPVDAASNDHLKKVFRAYCRLRVGQGRQVGSHQHINAAQFNEMCRDAGLLEPYGPLSQCAVDIVFIRCRPPGSRRLSFKEFLEAVASVAEEAGYTFDAVTDALVITSTSSPPPSPQLGQKEGEFYGSAGLMATAAARGSLGSAHAQLRISDLIDNKVGPVVPSRGSTLSRGSAVTSSYDSALPVLPHSAGPASPGAADRSNSPLTAALRNLRHSYTGNVGTASIVSARLAAAGGPGQERQLGGKGVRNPLYEGTDDGQATGKELEACVHALEGKLTNRAPASAAEGGIAAGAFTGDLLARLRSTETQMAHQEQQLAAVVGQQEALKEVITRLVESLEDQKLARNSAAVAEVQELQQQVKTLSLEVGQLRALKIWFENHASEDTLQELSRRVEDRQTRAETAIYQVARQVDVLDAKLRDEIESSMSALQAILANASPVK